MRRSPLASVITSALLAVAGVSGASSAAAHDTLVGSTPAAGAVLETAPSQVHLRFAETALALGSEIEVDGPGGSTVKVKPTVANTVVSAPLAANTPGSYRVLWRVTSADGHPVSGTFRFTVTKGNPATHTSTSSTPNAAGIGASTVTSSPATVAGPSSPTINEPGDNEPALVIGGFAALAALVAAGWFVARRRVHDDPR